MDYFDFLRSFEEGSNHKIVRLYNGRVQNREELDLMVFVVVGDNRGGPVYKPHCPGALTVCSRCPTGHAVGRLASVLRRCGRPGPARGACRLLLGRQVLLEGRYATTKLKILDQIDLYNIFVPTTFVKSKPTVTVVGKVLLVIKGYLFLY